MSLASTIEKIWLRLPRRQDVLVFDEVGSKWLEKAVLTDIPFAVLHTRFERYYAAPSVLAELFLSLGKLPWAYLWEVKFHFRRVRGMMYMIYLLACIKAMRPKVVITFTDNDWKFQMISRRCPGVEFFAVQNGVRSKFNLLYDTPPAPHPANKISMPHLFCFGEIEKKLYREYGHIVDNFHPIGSIKASYYMEKVAPNRPNIEFDICVVSQWATPVMLGSAYPEIKKSLNIMDGFLAKYIASKPLRLCVALREGRAEEIKYFRSYYGDGATLIDQDAESMSSYGAIDRSEMVLVLDSTAGREALGMGKKVLFCNFTGFDMYDTQVPSIFRVSDEHFETFESVLDCLGRYRDVSTLTKDVMWPTKAISNGCESGVSRLRTLIICACAPAFNRERTQLDQ